MFKILSLKKYVSFVAIIMLASMVGEWNAQAMDEKAENVNPQPKKGGIAVSEILNKAEEPEKGVTSNRRSPVKLVRPEGQKYKEWETMDAETLFKLGRTAYENEDHTLALAFFERSGGYGLLDGLCMAGMLNLRMSYYTEDLQIKEGCFKKACEHFMQAFYNGLPETDKKEALKLFETIYLKYINDKRYDLASIYTEYASKLRNIPAKKQIKL